MQRSITSAIGRFAAGSVTESIFSHHGFDAPIAPQTIVSDSTHALGADDFLLVR
jgi:hypothetical protein